MQPSAKRLAANIANSRRSTGPRTEAGKQRSRANAITHGLCSFTCIPEDATLIQERATALFRAFKPYTDYQAWALDRASVYTLRLERVEAIERRIRDKISLRAELTWDDDRRLEAEVLGGMLSRKPSETLAALHKTLHGCEWLIKRWAMLAHAADTSSDGSWTAEQTAMAFDLMGTPAAFRTGKPGTSIDLHGRVDEPDEGLAAVARRMVDELIARMEEVAPLDAVDRSLAMADFDHDKSAELKRLRRYETMLHTRVRWAVKQMQFQGPLGPTDPGYYPTWKVEPTPEEKPEPKTEDEKAAESHDPNSWSPPFCLTPDEFPSPGEKADIPAILQSRKEKRLARAETRRQAKRRKVESLYKA